MSSLGERGFLFCRCATSLRFLRQGERGPHLEAKGNDVELIAGSALTPSKSLEFTAQISTCT